MSNFDLKVHHYDDKGRVTKVTPYCRLMNPNDRTTVYISGGKAWAGPGEMINPVPDWVVDEIKIMNPVVVREVGFGFVIDKSKTDPGLPLSERMKLSVSKGHMAQEEYDTMFPKQQLLETPIEVDTSKEISSHSEGYKTIEEAQADISAQAGIPEGSDGSEGEKITLTPEMNISNMPWKELLEACKARGIKKMPSDKADELRSKLTEVTKN